MKKKNLAMLLCATMVAFLSACSNYDYNWTESDSTKQDFPNEKNITTRGIAKFIARINKDVPLCKEVQTMVKNSIINGRDEAITFKEILQSDFNGTRASNCSLLKHRIQNRFSKDLTRSSPEVEEEEYEQIEEDEMMEVPEEIEDLIGSDCQIYCPYSEDWEEGEEPVIAYMPEDDEDGDVCYAYYEREDMEGCTILDSILIDENYAQMHPVWIINKIKPLPEGSYYAVPVSSNANDSSTIATPVINNVYCWTLTQMQVTKNYDSWLAGGSEFDFQIIFPELTGYTCTINKFRVTFTRKEIKRKTIKNYDIILNSNWRVEQKTNGIIIYEGDPSTRIKEGKITTRNDNGNIETTFTYGNYDDFVGQTSIDREFMLSSSNDFYAIDGGHIKLKMPVIIK